MEQVAMNDRSIIPASTAIETFRDSGYKSTASALAELIDNSIEADADNIQIITFEKEVQSRQRMLTKISEIMIYDDGIGMTEEVLSICLQFGNGTRLSSRDGMGRFGIGLPNASVSQCKRVEVYSWRNGQCHFTYLDVDEVKNEAQHDVNEVEKVSMPSKLLEKVEGTIKSSGTIILWKSCDRLDISRARTLFKRIDKELCRSYRHFLDTDDIYGRRRNINLINTSDNNTIRLRPNDPLYLMTPSTTPEFEEEPSNVLHGDIIKLAIPCDDYGNTSEVELRFSVAFPNTQSLGGNSPTGQHYRQNTGISFVRAGREIDFGTFGYFNPQDERHRWWGCEIRFTPVLDEIFGVTNNKQAVRGIHYLDLKEFKNDHPEDWDHMLQDDSKLFLREQLSRVISHNLKTLEDVIKSRGKGARGENAKERARLSKSSKIANKELETSKVDTHSENIGSKKTDKQKVDEWAKVLIEGDETLTAKQAVDVAEEKIDLKVDKSFNSWPGNQFFTVEVTGSTCNLVINRKHPFFSELYEPLVEQDEHKYLDALDLLLMAYARMQDELYNRIDDIEDINSTWGTHLRRFLQKLNSEA
jgi:hypothetical protein